MGGESVSMVAATAAGLDREPIDGWDGRTHRLRYSYGVEPDMHGLCVCGFVAVGADAVQVGRLIELHVEAVVGERERAEAREVTPRRIGEARAAIAEGAARKAGEP